MVTRKPVPARPSVSTNTASAAGSNAPPYPTTPATESAKTTATGSSVYSPDLSTSPAFDLIDMKEAQQRPRRDSDVSSHGTWDDSDEEPEEREVAEDYVEVPKPLNVRPSQLNLADQNHRAVGTDDLPAILKPGPANPPPTDSRTYADEVQANPWQLESNNPYLRQNAFGTQSSQTAWADATPMPAPPQPPIQPAHPPPIPPQAPPPLPVELPAEGSPTQEMGKMAIEESRPDEPARKASYKTAEVLPVPQLKKAPVPASGPSADVQAFPSTNPWRRPSMPDSRSDGIVPPPKAPLSPITHTQPQYAPPPGPPPAASSGRNGQYVQSPPLPPVQTAISPATSPLPGTLGSPGGGRDRQKNENYQIKHINWSDASNSSGLRSETSMRRSPILTQNANGPCPLLALVNALVLSTPSNFDTPLMHTLESRENVSLGLLLDAVFDELTSGRRGDLAHELPDISELYTFLLTLHTGMNVNPQFIEAQQTPHVPVGTSDLQGKLGTFQETREMRLYSTFDIPLIHGWTAPMGTPAYEAFLRSAHTFEDAQNIQFAESELEHKQSSERLKPQEQQTLQDIGTIKTFLNSWPTQLTDHGLDVISKSLALGQIAILFRNDHFSTLYKEPTHGALMTLVTDAGYSSHDEIVWESLVDVSGAANELFSGDFRSVSHGQSSGSTNEIGGSGWAEAQARTRPNRDAQAPLRVSDGGESSSVPPPLPGPRPNTRAAATHGEDVVNPSEAERKAAEQEDHDLALALQLQEEEEDQQRQAEQRRRRELELNEQFLSSEENRPPIPPRRSASSQQQTTSQSQGRNPVPPRGRSSANLTLRPGVSRPGADEDPDAPPTYEQAASDRPYRPAGSTAAPSQGNPLNAYDALRAAALRDSSTSVNVIPRPDHQRRRSDGNRLRRRSSQLGAAYPSSPVAQQAPAYSPRIPGAANVRDAEGDRCVVM